MDDLAQWLGEQLDDDERIARAATLGPWVQSGIGDYGWTVDFGHPGSGVETANTEQGLADADFIAAHNPARVLREIDAKRKLLALYVEHERLDRETFEAEDEHARSLVSLRAAYLDAVRHHAAVYDHRPGYREEWRP
ncbi:DUF6221 family protein [Streptomyces sp. NPDC056105]|uniref:DUF6221 family protein n=1 Tax=Streptomyces sp. NPDC056105 TaxID=3345714 RepID=UPI0035DE0FF8